MIDFADMRAREAVFTHIDDMSGAQTTYAVTRLTEACAVLDPVCVPISREFAGWCVEHRGIEWARVERLTRAQLALPLLFATQNDGTHLLVDGHHRYVRLAFEGGSTTLAWVLEPCEWAPFVVRGVRAFANSDELLAVPSGH